MNLPFCAKEKLIVGIDIGSHSVKICQLQRSNDEYEVLSLGSNLLPEGAVDDGTLHDPEQVGNIIKNLLKHLKIKNRKVGFAMSGFSVVVKKIALPHMDEELIKDHILSEAEQYIPFDINEVYLDFQDLKTNREGSERTDVLLAAAKKDVVDAYLEMFKSINLFPTVVDVDGFALGNAYKYNHPESSNVALVDIGASKINMNVMLDEAATMARDIVVGSRELTDQIQYELDIDFEEAEALKLGIQPAGDKQAAIEEIFNSRCNQWIEEIKTAIDLYHANNRREPLSKLIICGGGSNITGFAELLEQSIDLPVEQFNPFSNMITNPRKIDPEYLAQVGPEMAIAAGLAIRTSEI
ncbi:MAG: type IV pilus assembly protein PilM [Desulfobulbaceae bacterium]|uniref:Type IV pilus assembly protein PilM n=1 Tax=Candidatus Desulfatifera sulfidica TaxID=2841691 RepID=A0A8J6NAB1_9BACT|nr:type IV pilus assembly protein PilM [Candidatus Desulfatifera sulfidica]